jgi:FKBP-type peptidyl-prolyl cis-trans isomerase
MMRTGSLFLLFFLLLGSSCQKDSITRFEDERREIRKYLEDLNLDYQEHSTGLFIVSDIPGETCAAGPYACSPSPSSQVEVRYVGSYLDGEVFDQTQGNATVKFRLYNLVLGWQYGLQLMTKGETARLFIPSRLGYGPNPPGGIRANAILVFEVELIDYVD